jgi:5'-nucleotidase (lipoprotein e(P4) family)
MSKIKSSVLFAVLLTAAIFATYISIKTTAQQTQAGPAADNEYQIGAVLYFQTAAENRALFYQAFELAKLRLDQKLKECEKLKKKLPCAVVTDIDETALDNSPNLAFLIKNRRASNADDWQKWFDMQAAKPLPGALEFFKYAASKNIRVFYVSNREAAQKSATVGNLQKAGFPDASDETVLLRAETSSKEPRRQMIAQKHRIVMLLGDNLNDLAQVFERKSITDRFAAVDNLKADFGSRFIVLPNPMYGEWESAIYDYARRTDEEKATLRRNALQSY